MGMNPRLCPCGSGRPFPECCEPYSLMLGLEFKPELSTIFFEWLLVYSTPIFASFMQKVGSYVFRISAYLDGVMDKFFTFGFERNTTNKDDADEAIVSIKNNILHSLLASLSCLSQGLFLQSGSLLRSSTEDCLVLLDLFENSGQMEKLLDGKYKVNDLVSRVKKAIPHDFIEWYGYFSKNFIHFGPLHPAPYLPRACFGDNYILVAGLQNLVRAIITFHVVLERVYFDKTPIPLLWKRVEGEKDLVFNDDSPVFDWAGELGKEIVAQYPPSARKEGFLYSSKSYHFE
jgi:hypothetical protein